MRSTLREFFPAALDAFGADLSHPDAVSVLARASTPPVAAKLSTSAIAAVLRTGGRQRNVERRASEIRSALRAQRLDAPVTVTVRLRRPGRLDGGGHRRDVPPDRAPRDRAGPKF